MSTTESIVAIPLWISLKTALAATVLSGVLGILVARWRMRSVSPGAHVLDAFLLLPLALPPTVMGMLLLLAFGRKSPIGSALEQIGTTFVYSWPGAVLAAFVVSFPIAYQTAKGAFRQLDGALLDAAHLFSGSEWRILRRIMLPLAWPGIAAGLILTFMRALGEFGATVMIAGNIPGRTQTAPVAIFFAVESGDIRSGMILSAALLILSFAAILVVTRLQRH
ncbi:MAG TPA: molybdate ABC transporter permease subunit [Chthoniobacteraceae bacterium]|nr:molybdate ABC transporter permease subunit [Chthoniobacteraceae bacterium]